MYYGSSVIGREAGVSHALTRWLVEPARPARIRESPNAHWLVVATVCVGAFMGQLDASITTLALPSLQRSFGASLGAVEWVTLSYLLVLVGAVTMVGRFGDMVGRKLLYTYGFALFTLASLACGLAPDMASLIVFRVIQGFGAAMLQANSVALITLAMPAGTLGRGIGIQGAAQAVGLALGPTVGGLLIELGGWPLIFFVNVPAGVIGVVLGWFLLPRSRNLADRARFDWLGLALLAPAVSALLLALSLHGLPAPAVAALLVAAVALGAALVMVERRAATPLLDPKLFRRVAFSSGISAGLLSYMVLFGILFVVPYFLENARHFSSGTAGLILTALPVTLGLAAPIAGRLADRRGSRLPTVTGMVVTAAVLAITAIAHSPTWVLVVELAVAGVGLGLFTPANNASIMAATPRQQSGSGGGILNMTRGIGTALGVAVTGLVFAAFGGTGSASGVRDGFVAGLVLLAALALASAALGATRPAGVQSAD